MLEKEEHRDSLSVILSPNPEEGEVGVYNSTTDQRNSSSWPRPLVYRADLGEGGIKRTSVIKRRWLFPDKEKKLRVEGISEEYLAPEHDFEDSAVEDPRMHINGEVLVTYVGVSGKGTNALGCLAIAPDTSAKPRKIGVISPNIPTKEAIKLTRDRRLKKALGQFYAGQYAHAERIGFNGEILPYNKDPALIKFTNNPNFFQILRIGNDIQYAVASNPKEFTEKSFWREWFPQSEKYTLMKSRDLPSWAKRRIGLGGPPEEYDGKLLAPWHGFTGSRKIVYRGSMLEMAIDGNELRVRGAMLDPVINPTKRDILREGDTEKWVSFPTAIVPLPYHPDSLGVLTGNDHEIMLYTTSRKWILQEMADPHNQYRRS